MFGRGKYWQRAKKRKAQRLEAAGFIEGDGFGEHIPFIVSNRERHVQGTATSGCGLLSLKHTAWLCCNARPNRWFQSMYIPHDQSKGPHDPRLPNLQSVGGSAARCLTHGALHYQGERNVDINEIDPPAWMVAILFVLLMLLVGLMEGPDIEEHARWMQEVKESGAAVLW